MAIDYTFHGQRPNEEVVTVFMRHPWSYIKLILGLTIFLLLPWVVYLFSAFNRTFSITLAATVITALFWLMLIIYLWRSNIVILTNERVIVVDVKDPVSRKVIDVPLKNIQNITFENKGLAQTIFGYGNIVLQTAGSSDSEIVLKNLGSPFDVQQLISKTGKL